jgi:DNA-binding transcriptional MocR family regulator
LAINGHGHAPQLQLRQHWPHRYIAARTRDRVGWIAAGRYQARVDQLKAARYLATATLPQLAIAEFLANGSYDYHLRTMRRAYARQAAAVVRAVRQHFPPGTRVVEPAGGMVVWVELPAAVDARELYARARQVGITVAPGPLVSAKARYRACVRLSAAWWSPSIARALRTLGAIAAELCDAAPGRPAHATRPAPGIGNPVAATLAE